VASLIAKSASTLAVEEGCMPPGPDQSPPPPPPPPGPPPPEPPNGPPPLHVAPDMLASAMAPRLVASPWSPCNTLSRRDEATEVAIHCGDDEGEARLRTGSVRCDRTTWGRLGENLELSIQQPCPVVDVSVKAFIALVFLLRRRVRRSRSECVEVAYGMGSLCHGVNESDPKLKSLSAMPVFRLS
jgi:hypothetical protein